MKRVHLHLTPQVQVSKGAGLPGLLALAAPLDTASTAFRPTRDAVVLSAQAGADSVRRRMIGLSPSVVHHRPLFVHCMGNRDAVRLSLEVLTAGVG